MKVFISADMEGISGVTRGAMTESNHADFALARGLMTKDVNAAVQGALQAGATEIWVKDAHGSANNLIVEDVAAPAQVIQGWAEVSRMMQGIDETFDAALLVGYHARAQTDKGNISHTMTGQTRRLWYNDVELGEYGISAAHAGDYGVPVVFASGDEALCVETKQVLGERVETVAVKSAYARQCVRLLSIEDAHERIRQGVARALSQVGRIAPFRPASPIQVKLQFQTPLQACSAALVPTVERIDSHTVHTAASGGLAAADMVEVLLRMAH